MGKIKDKTATKAEACDVIECAILMRYLEYIDTGSDKNTAITEAKIIEKATNYLLNVLTKDIH